jgi:alkylation response protein AidB-like acyl-CoA dehydrogenase
MMAERVYSEAVRILGGQGYTRKWPLEKYLRDVRALQIYEATNQIQRIVISSML